jgi:hypothetical protein
MNDNILEEEEKNNKSNAQKKNDIQHTNVTDIRESDVCVASFVTRERAENVCNNTNDMLGFERKKKKNRSARHFFPSRPTMIIKICDTVHMI